jgi:hypothetical protein
MLKGLKIGQLARNALEHIEGHLPRQPESDKTTVAQQETHIQDAQRSQEAYLAWQLMETI